MAFGPSRHELKFLFPTAAKGDFLQGLDFGLAPDSNAGDTGAYRVSSLYYDTPRLDAVYEKIDGILRRKKFRLRYYGTPEPQPAAAFFEIKHRYGNKISKERVRLTPEMTQRLLAEQADLCELRQMADTSPVAGRILKFHAETPLQPVVIVSYLREAWVGSEDPSLRVTWDHELTAHPPDDYLSPGSSSGVQFLPSDQVVLEVKFDELLPRWLQQRLIHHGLRPIRYSKYLEAVLARNLVS